MSKHEMLVREAQLLVNVLVVMGNSPQRNAWKALRALGKAKDRRDRRMAARNAHMDSAIIQRPQPQPEPDGDVLFA